MTAPLHEPTAEAAPSAAEEAAVAGAESKSVQGRSLGRIAWERLKRDKLALTGAVVVLLLVAVALLAPVITSLLGQDPNEYHEDLIDPLFGTPVGSLGGISGDHLLGVEPVNGRDILARILYGARISLLVGFLSAVVAVIFGTVFGVLAGFFGGWVDSLISRVMDGLLAFPQLLFIIALVSVMPNDMLGLHGTGVRVFVMILVIGFFGWPYIGRVVRGQTLSMREREYVEAARSLGAGRFYILFKELLPNLVAPIIVYTTMMIPTNILTEAALSFLGVGVKPPTASWGQMLSSAIEYYESDPMYMVVPGVAIFITVLAFNLFGDGVRDALDPKGSR
ncbi:ABC transporter permease [Streptomyces griseoviridis]|jgi:peptide/nickel transport system permease protein|uniref:Peptide/nickel transport system permease protein n=3 Tax=Streptomyces TaxID=1883 RepID=A0ABT9LKK8_STRGD|nr:MULTISPECIES: ABC transporter permease [Streptomyces]MDP9684214.1 peptide/nickel transport system permease protein [Streptomyces griseoviridis]GGS59495.1 peptide ABC transporter permease [Streptomyces niveoruber]GGT02183.1 peptide ABC transporter permease [Streptomyces griseoviridis]GGU39471.1 peptide ABC transporter permease [Streptomyces daghestanicus]GHI30828.1 peptide ABC transporter permease [Streptomyces daghestanicus]